MDLIGNFSTGKIGPDPLGINGSIYCYNCDGTPGDAGIGSFTATKK
jgi:hypothetical protein